MSVRADNVGSAGLSRARQMLPAAAGVLLLALAGGMAWRALRPRPVYTSQGYGGFIPPKASAAPAPRAVADPVGPAMAAYTAGRYAEAEALAQPLAARSASAAGPTERLDGLRAQWVLAFCAARRGDLPLARERFAALEREAGGRGGRYGSVGVWEYGGPSDGERTPNTDRFAGSRPTPDILAAEAAYQHAVLTAALGEKKAAEREFIAFLRRYPESPLVHAAVWRIGRLHGGDVPPAAERAWRQAMRIARARQKERERQNAMCGPECLVELLRRRTTNDQRRTTNDERSTGGSMGVWRVPATGGDGRVGVGGAVGGPSAERRTTNDERPTTDRRGGAGVWRVATTASDGGVGVASPGNRSKAQRLGPDARHPIPDTQSRTTHHAPLTTHQLTLEMGTDERGTSLAAMAEAARKRGFRARGLQLTEKGLPEQKLPLIAVLQPGHYVLVEAADGRSVRVWNPDALGPGRPGTKEYTLDDWRRFWSGIVLTVD
jgi:hypothetical protein